MEDDKKTKKSDTIKVCMPENTKKGVELFDKVLTHYEKTRN